MDQHRVGYIYIFISRSDQENLRIWSVQSQALGSCSNFYRNQNVRIVGDLGYFEDPEDPSKATDACFNTNNMSLFDNIHSLWGKGRFILRPMSPTQQQYWAESWVLLAASSPAYPSTPLQTPLNLSSRLYLQEILIALIELRSPTKSRADTGCSQVRKHLMLTTTDLQNHTLPSF